MSNHTSSHRPAYQFWNSILKTKLYHHKCLKLFILLKPLKDTVVTKQKEHEVSPVLFFTTTHNRIRNPDRRCGTLSLFTAIFTACLVPTNTARDLARVTAV